MSGPSSSQLPHLRRAATACALLLLALGGTTTGAWAQDPAPPPVEAPVQGEVPAQGEAPESVETPAPGESPEPIQPLGGAGDAIADTLQDPSVPSDTLAADSLEVREVQHLPSSTPHDPSGWETGVWEWDQEALLATRALTLVDLLSEATGILPLQGGDFGQPAAVTGFGLEGGRVRIFRDGIEVAPLDGGVVDLSRVGLGGIGNVRLERGVGGLRIDLTPTRLEDPRAYTLLEIGTGDLNTNFFRGQFGHPFALGGGLVAFIDRIDTEGTNRSEPGVSFGAGIRHTVLIGDRGGIAWDYRSMSSKRPASIWSPATIRRSDFGVQGRYAFHPGILGTVWYRSSSQKPGEENADPSAPPELGEDPRRVAGLRLAVERGPLWGEVVAQKQWGERWPTSVQSIRGGGNLPSIGGISVGIEREGWSGGKSALDTRIRAWTAPRFGISLFAEIQQGERGIPGRLPPAPPLPEEGEEEEEEEGQIPMDPWLPSFTDRSGLRAGGVFRAGGFEVGGALLRIEADSLHPMAFQPDRDGVGLVGGERSGVELTLRLPVSRIMEGLALEGSGQIWDEDNEWRYLPSRIYQARLRYHRVFMESRNLEVWWDLGVNGRNAMTVPATVPGEVGDEVPFRQSWFARVQVRVISVRLFIDWENVSARERNQDFPDRILPRMRLAYGIRWTLWN